MKKKIIAGILVFLGIVTVAIFVWLQKTNETVSPQRGEIIEAIYALGKVKADRRYEMKMGILTVVEKLFVREGDTVRKGSPLIKMTDSRVFKAPFAGMVTLVSANEGEPVVPNATVVRVEDVSKKFIEVSLEQQGALRVKKGQPAEVVFESLRGEKLHGKVISLFARNDDFLAHIEVDGGLRDNILPGMTADVAIVVARHDDALLIPVSAVSNGMLTLERNGKKIKTSVRLGAIDGQMAQVLEGEIKEDDKILIGKKN